MKLLITGPESTGKTTLANYVQSQFQWQLIKEYGREYLETNGPNYVYDDILVMAKKHYEIINSQTQPNLILDTYLLNYKIWSEYKFGKCDPWIIHALDECKPVFTILCSPDMEWTYDPLRETPETREEIFNLFRLEIENRNWPYEVISGSKNKRELLALELIRNFL